MSNEKNIVDIEEYAKKGEKPPKGNVIYRFRVGTVHAESDQPTITGREILVKVGLIPEENRLYQKLKGNLRIPVQLTDTVDLSEPGLERFETLPLDPTEG